MALALGGLEDLSEDLDPGLHHLGELRGTTVNYNIINVHVFHIKITAFASHIIS